MRIETDRGGRVTVTADSTVLPAIFALCGLAILIVGTRSWLQGDADMAKLAGAIIGGMMFLGAGAAFFERGRFIFDPGTRTVGWSRRRLRSERSGRLTFDQIKCVVLQRGSGEKSAMLRIALIMEEGELPITASYGGNNRHLQDGANAMRRVLGLGGDLAEDSILAAVRAGRRFDAIAIARTMRGLDSTEAKRLVDEIVAKSRGG
jgi:hypothetical protein